MKKIKRILAFIGAILLVCLYGSTLIFALMNSPVSTGFFKASVAATILLPVLLYTYILTARVLKGRGLDPDSHPEIDPDEAPAEKREKDSDV